MITIMRHHNISDMMVFYVDDVPAYDLGDPQCGVNPTRSNPAGCTKSKNHNGDHGNPNWSGHLEVQNSFDALTIETFNSHAGSPVRIHDRAEAEALLKFLQERFDAKWPVANKTSA